MRTVLLTLLPRPAARRDTGCCCWPRRGLRLQPPRPIRNARQQTTATHLHEAVVARLGRAEGAPDCAGAGLVVLLQRGADGEPSPCVACTWRHTRRPEHARGRCGRSGGLAELQSHVERAGGCETWRTGGCWVVQSGAGAAGQRKLPDPKIFRSGSWTSRQIVRVTSHTFAPGG